MRWTALCATVVTIAVTVWLLRSPSPLLTEDDLRASAEGITLRMGGPVFDGVFLQPDRSAGWEDPERRTADLTRAAKLGVGFVVVQYLAHGSESLLTPRPDGGSEVGDLLDDAHGLGLEVWLGTREDPALWEAETVSHPVWSAAGAASSDIARKTVEQHGEHPAFVGWYWTPEAVWVEEPSARRLQQLARVTRRGVRSLKAAADKPVAVPLGPAYTGANALHFGAWCRYLETTEADRVVAMDGVGTAHLDIAGLDRFYTGLRGCAEELGIELVADIEVFGPGLPPAPARLHAQWTASRAAHSRVAFDLPHYLQPSMEGTRFWVRPEAAVPVPVKTSRRDGYGARVETATAPNRLDVLTAPPHPAAVEVYAILDQGDAQLLGDTTAMHGPGKAERTWLWRAPEGGEPITEFEVVVRHEGKAGPWDIEAFATSDSQPE